MYRTDLIKEAVEKEGLVAIAARSGVSTDTVARARDGENLSIQSLEMIAASIGVMRSDLFAAEREQLAA